MDLFAGPGGLDVAAQFLGFKSIGIEWDRDACETRYAAGLPTIHADVSVMRETRFDEIPKSVDVLAGGPPCQSFSVAGNGAGGFEYLENTGTATSAAFVIRTGGANPFADEQVMYCATLALADLDGDGDFDLVSGSYFGWFDIFENTGNSVGPAPAGE